MSSNKYLFFLLLFINSFCYSQPPQAMNYQASMIDQNNIPISNKTFNVRISIIDSINISPIVYQETFLVTTDSFGLFNVEIGNGIPVIGTFNSIDWSHNKKWQQTEVDTSGGSIYSLMGISQFVSVPYALYAEKSSNSIEGFGNYQNNFSINTIYHPSEDGFVIATALNSGTLCLGESVGHIYIDTIPNLSIAFANISFQGTTTIPVKKNYYWKVARDLNCTIATGFRIIWLPLK